MALLHSPAPFTVRKHTDTQSTSVYCSGWTRPVASVRGRTPEEQAANAALFSAAPDLLEACRALLHVWGAIDRTGGSPKARHAGTLAEAAIAKAEGR